MDYGTNKSNISQYTIKPTLKIRLSENLPLRLQYRFESITAPLPLDEYYSGDVDASGNLQRAIFTETYFHHQSNQVVADLPGKFSIGPVKNTFLVGFDYYHQSGGWFGNQSLAPASINIYSPV